MTRDFLKKSIFARDVEGAKSIRNNEKNLSESENYYGNIYFGEHHVLSMHHYSGMILSKKEGQRSKMSKRVCES